MKAPPAIEQASAAPASAAVPAGPPQAFDVQQHLLQTLEPMGPGARLWVAGLVAVCTLGLGAYVWQLRKGLAVTAMNDYFSWGVYIVNFVFFIGISMAGTLISALLRLSGAEWRRPITRLAEAITLFSLLVAAPMILIDMGRIDRFWHLLVYGRLQSPILWDVLSLNTYMAGSILYLYLPMIPDLAILRDSPQRFPGWRRRLYSVLAMGWQGGHEQRERLEKAVAVLAIVIIPVAISIHTVTAWLFGMTLRPGWHSTIIGPDFVIGALYSGIAAVITAIAVFRHAFSLQPILLTEHFRKLGRLLLIFGLGYAYFVVNEHLGDIYTNERSQQSLGRLIFSGRYAVQFWGMIVIGLVVPIILLLAPGRHPVGSIVTASALVNVGMWLKRYIIVVPTLASPMMPTAAGKTLAYIPTPVEWAITAGGFAAFCLLYTLFAKLFPIVSIWEMQQPDSPQE